MWLTEILSRVFSGVYDSTMRKRRRNVSEDRLTITQGSKRAKTQLCEIDNSVWIPVDLIIEILSRLPAKSIARCRCVSKLWDSIIRSPDFTELYFTKSSTRPQLLISCRKDGESLLFSAPQVQNPDENSPLLAASYIMKLPTNDENEIRGHVRGLFSLAYERREEMLSVICNPATRQTINLPNVMGTGMRSYLGYDPIDKHYKILMYVMSPSEDEEEEIIHEEIKVQVLTLGSREQSWRMIECSIPHHPTSNAVCINGVLYYRARVCRRESMINGDLYRSRFCGSESMIIGFDVRSEKFKTFTFGEATKAVRRGVLINYNGKLGSLVSDIGYCGFNGARKSIHLWVLQDAEKQEWSEHIYLLPASWKNMVGETFLGITGVTRTNDIVLSPLYRQATPYSVFYYSMERKTVMRVGIQGLEAYEDHIVNTYLDHVEDVKPITL